MFDDVAAIVEKGEKICIRFTLDGIEMQKRTTVVNATIKFLNISIDIHAYSSHLRLGRLRAKYQEWLVGSALCSENYESVKTQFGELFFAVDSLNVRK